MKGIYSCPLVSSLHLIPEESMKDYPTGGHLNSIFADAGSTPAASTTIFIIKTKIYKIYAS